MQLTCPHCQFSKQIPDERLPSAATRVTCPQCKEIFPLPQKKVETVIPAIINCPACHLEQPETEACSSCGLIFAKYSAPQPTQPLGSPVEKRSDRLQDKPKAGFWLRLIALMIDGLLIFLLQVVFSVLLMLISGNGFQLHGSISILVQLFSTVLSLFYWIFFTGYCGQTPGKMLFRIKVIVTDGSSLSYGKAFYREVVGKFISGIIFGIGYLMAAFDDQKQGLHDRMAKTYVIKL